MRQEPGLVETMPQDRQSADGRASLIRFYKELEDKGRSMAQVARDGSPDEARLADLSAYVRAKATVLREEPFDPAANDADRLLQERHKTLEAHVKDLQHQEVQCHSVRQALTIQTPPADGAPSPPLMVLSLGVATLGVSFGASLEPLLFSIDDDVVQWVMALLLGSGIGAFITYGLFEDASDGGQT